MPSRMYNTAPVSPAFNQRRNTTVSAFQPQPSWPPNFWRYVAIGVTSFIINLLAFILPIAFLYKNKKAVYPPSVMGILAATLFLSNALIDLSLWKEESRMGVRRWPQLRFVARQAVFALALVSIITALAIMTTLGIDSDGLHQEASGSLHVSQATSVVSCLAIVSNVMLLATVAKLTWRPVHGAARSAMAIASILLFTVGALFITVNSQPQINHDIALRSIYASTFALHQHVGAILTGASVLGIAICTAISEGNRINKLLTSFIRFYIVISILSAILCTIVLCLSTWLFFDSHVKTVIQRATLTTDPILAGVALILIAVCLVAANYLQEPPLSHLAVEPIDLAALTPIQRAAYAKLIGKNGKLVPGAPSGDAAMSLMQAYTNSSLPGMTCIVLRVYKPSLSQEKLSLKKSYEDDHAWRQLDEEQMVFRQVSMYRQNSELLSAEKSPVAPPKLSKYQLKKLARKQANAAAKGDVLDMPLESEASPIDEALDLEFIAKLESTEALILLTTIESYDLTASVKGLGGRLLQRTLGGKSYFKPFCVRLGLLAFHWPFRESTFYCSYARRPVARSAAVLRAISEWNKARPKSSRCSVLLDPTYQHEAAERAIVPSGWQPTPLPASHIIDLRPYKGKTLAEYLKAIKYRDQESAFKKAGGEVVESGSFTAEECAEVMRLWHQIAEKRTSSGETAVLADPDEHFLQQLGSGSTSDRSLMFLKANGQTIASCVLFRLGDTITSDLQGLDYEHARPLKAYFVMMQHVIGIALREGHSFVDFGPTTSKPKLDIGCKSVPLIGAMYALSPLISSAIGIAARNTRQKLQSPE